MPMEDICRISVFLMKRQAIRKQIASCPKIDVSGVKFSALRESFMQGLLHFADLELDLNLYELRQAGRVLKLERIPMDLLVFLVEQRGRLVTREQIVNRIWGDQVHIDTVNGINTAIRKIRNVLKDDPVKPKFLETVPERDIALSPR